VLRQRLRQLNDSDPSVVTNSDVTSTVTQQLDTGPGVPGCPTCPAQEVRLLVDHRRDLVAERTRIQSRLRWHLHGLDPALIVPSRGLRRFCMLDALVETLVGHRGVLTRLAREQVARCRELTVQINQLERELRELMRRLARRLLTLPGCGVLGAATLFAETASASRFRSKDAYARFTGTAPIPAWSGNSAGKVRLNRGTAPPTAPCT
jgi:transposase